MIRGTRGRFGIAVALVAMLTRGVFGGVALAL
jgi:hypothetical protein